MTTFNENVCRHQACRLFRRHIVTLKLLAYLLVICCLFFPTISFSSSDDFSSSSDVKELLNQANTLLYEATELRQGRDQNEINHCKQMYRQLFSGHFEKSNIAKSLKAKREARADLESELKLVQQSPVYTAEDIQKMKDKVDKLLTEEEDERQKLFNLYASGSGGLGQTKEQEEETLRKQSSKCVELEKRDQDIEKRAQDLEKTAHELEKRAEKITRFRLNKICDYLLGEFYRESVADQPSAQSIERIIKQAEGCPWLEKSSAWKYGPDRAERIRAQAFDELDKQIEAENDRIESLNQAEKWRFFLRDLIKELDEDNQDIAGDESDTESALPPENPDVAEELNVEPADVPQANSSSTPDRAAPDQSEDSRTQAHTQDPTDIDGGGLLISGPARIEAGAEAFFRATDGAGKVYKNDVAWSVSSDELVAIGLDGRIRALKPGRFSILAKKDELQADMEVSVFALLPDLQDETAQIALGLLKDLGINATPTLGIPADSDDQAGRVQKTFPGPGTEIVDQKVSVELYAAPIQLTVPVFNGNTVAAAKEKLKQLDLSYGGVILGEPASDKEQVGRVQSSEPKEGAPIGPGGEVVLTVWADVDAPAFDDCSQYPGSSPEYMEFVGRTICVCPDGETADTTGSCVTKPEEAEKKVADAQRDAEEVTYFDRQWMPRSWSTSGDSQEVIVNIFEAASRLGWAEALSLYTNGQSDVGISQHLYAAGDNMEKINRFSFEPHKALQDWERRQAKLIALAKKITHPNIERRNRDRKGLPNAIKSEAAALLKALSYQGAGSVEQMENCDSQYFRIGYHTAYAAQVLAVVGAAAEAGASTSWVRKAIGRANSHASAARGALRDLSKIGVASGACVDMDSVEPMINKAAQGTAYRLEKSDFAEQAWNTEYSALMGGGSGKCGGELTGIWRNMEGRGYLMRWTKNGDLYEGRYLNSLWQEQGFMEGQLFAVYRKTGSRTYKVAREVKGGQYNITVAGDFYSNGADFAAIGTYKRLSQMELSRLRKTNPNWAGQREWVIPGEVSYGPHDEFPDCSLKK